MQIFSLNETWQLYQTDQPDPIPATVPGCVHLDLLAAGLIPDPYDRANEQDLAVIGRIIWSGTGKSWTE